MSDSAVIASETARSRRRRQLLDATVATIAEYGAAGASLSRIAERAGMSKPAVLYHVDNRDALIASAVDEVLQRLTQRCAEAVAAAPDERSAVFSYVEVSLAHLWAHPDDLDVLTELPLVRVTPAIGLDARTETLAQAIAAGVAAGVLGTSDPSLTAVVVNGVIDAVAMHARDDDADERESIIAETVNVVDRILTPRT